MITYRDVTRRETAGEKLAGVAAAVRARDAEGALVEAGELEQGVLDALHPRRDGWGPVQEDLRALSCAAAEGYRAWRSGDSAAAALARAEEALRRLGRRRIPAALLIREPEGYIHYALDPLAYAGAAARYAGEAGEERAARAVVIGVRSIGTSLSALVATRLGTHRSATVRPRGATGERSVASEPALTRTLRRWLSDGGDALIVDEGPGATGETFVCVARWLRDLGVPPERIVLLPSHAGSPPLAGEERKEWFARARRFPPACADGRVEALCGRLGLAEPRDLSGGRWREVVPGAEDQPACTHHERLKHRAVDARGEAWLVRYCGLGRYGVEGALRAARLNALGLGPEVMALRDGFLVLRWIPGRSVRPAEAGSPEFAAALAGFLPRRLALFPVGRPVEVEPLVGLLRENATEALGPSPEGLPAALRRLEGLPPREAAIPDARPQLREWIRSPDGFHKTDALDHGNGVRFPGPVDPAWDTAAAVVEHGLAPGAAAELAALCAARAPDGAGGFADAVEAYRCAAVAAALGEAELSLRETGDPSERRRLGAEVERYRGLLRRELLRQHHLAG